MQYTGTIKKVLFAPGSKSERQAVMILLGERELLLRRKGGNPFYDETLEALVGKKITCNGSITETSLIMDEWEEL